MMTEPIKIAIYCEGGVGDYIVMTRLFHNFYEIFDQQAFDIFVRPGHLPAVNLCFYQAPFFRNLYAFDELPNKQLEYDLVIKVLNTVQYFLLQPQMLDNHPKIKTLIETAFQRVGSCYEQISKAPYADHQLARLATMLGYTRPQFLLYSAGMATDETMPIITLNAEHAEILPRYELAAKNYITIHDGWDNNSGLPPGWRATKTWPVRHWQRLIELLKVNYPQIPLVQIGSKNSVDLGCDHNMINRTTLAEAAWLIKGSALHIDTESGLVHLAHALGTKSICMIGPTNADFFAYPDNINLVAQNCQNCWWLKGDWMAKCVRDLAEPECMSLGILPEQVMASAAQYLSANFAEN